MKKMVGGLVGCFLSGAANAAIILDTTSLTDNGGLSFGSSVTTHQNPLGQSFVLTGDTNNLQIGAVLGDVSGSTAHDFRISVVSGAGVGGTSLGSLTFTESFNGSADSHLVMKDFSFLGVLFAGTYTAVFTGLENNYSSGIDYSVSGGDPLSDPFNSDGIITLNNDSTVDFLVRVTGDVSVGPVSVPVPVPVWLFGSGLLGLFGATVKRKRIDL